jgi:hypothetical protein
MEGDYSNFIRADLPFATFIDATIDEGGDWRDCAVNQLLDIMEPTEHVLFLEQDFLIKDKSFFRRLFKEDHDFLYYLERERIHPAFAVVRRDLIEKTRRDFSATPDKDHFGHFFEEISALATGEDIDNWVKWKEDYYHMQGLTQNYKCFQYQDPFFRPQTFFYFNYKSSLLPNQSPFYATMKKINKLERPDTHDFLDNFFP